MVTLTIDNKQVSVPAGTTILDAARAVDIHIPTLCYLREINEVASCRVCAVEVEGVDGDLLVVDGQGHNLISLPPLKPA